MTIMHKIIILTTLLIGNLCSAVDDRTISDEKFKAAFSIVMNDVVSEMKACIQIKSDAEKDWPTQEKLMKWNMSNDEKFISELKEIILKNFTDDEIDELVVMSKMKVRAKVKNPYIDIQLAILKSIGLDKSYFNKK